MLSYLRTNNDNPRILNYHLMTTKKELSKVRGGGRWRERGRRGGGEKEKKNQIEKRKERKQGYNLIKAGIVAYLGRDAIATLRSKASGDIGLQSREIVKAFTEYGGGTSLPPTFEHL